MLVLHLKKEPWEAISSAEKMVEYRDLKPYWSKRILDKNLEFVYFYLGYPPKGTPPLIRKIKEIHVNDKTQQIEIHLAITLEIMIYEAESIVKVAEEILPEKSLRTTPFVQPLLQNQKYWEGYLAGLKDAKEAVDRGEIK